MKCVICSRATTNSLKVDVREYPQGGDSRWVVKILGYCNRHHTQAVTKAQGMGWIK